MAEAVLVNVQSRLVDEGGFYPYTTIQVVVSDKLTQMCCLSFSDYKILSNISLTAIPNSTKFDKNKQIASPTSDKMWMDSGSTAQFIFHGRDTTLKGRSGAWFQCFCRIPD